MKTKKRPKIPSVHHNYKRLRIVDFTRFRAKFGEVSFFFLIVFGQKTKSGEEVKYRLVLKRIEYKIWSGLSGRTTLGYSIEYMYVHALRST